MNPHRWRWFTSVPIVALLLFVFPFDGLILVAANSEAAQTCRGGSAPPSPAANDDNLHQSVLSDIRRSISSSSDKPIVPLTFPADVERAANDFSDDKSKGRKAWQFLSGLASSPTFLNHYWHKRPLLIRACDTGDWIQDAFTVDRDLRLVDGSYISGHCTSEILRNGTRTDTWEFRPIKDDPARKTTWKEVEEALNGGTIYFNTAGSLWPTLGAISRLTNAAFGIPSNVNIYITPPLTKISVPPHTDRQDVFVFQTAGAKRWRVFAPPARIKGVDPLHRGKSGDVLSIESLGEPLIDAVIQKGDVLYVPTGFPHTTDTSTGESSLFDETSVSVTHIDEGTASNVNKY